LTAYYIFREGFIVFHGEERFRGVVKDEPKEVSSVMTVPMVVLGVMATVAGFFEGWYIHAIGGEHKEIHLNIAVTSVIVGLLGIALAYAIFAKKFLDPEKTYESLKAIHTTFKEQFFTEKLYHGVLAAGYMSYSKVLYVVGERQFIDGIVNGIAIIVQSIGQGLKFLQSGKLNWYALGLSSGFAILVLLLVALIYGGGS